MFQKAPADIALSQNTQPQSTRDDVETVVGPSVTVEGDFASEGNILVKGTVAGSVKTSRLLTVEKGAKILANVRAGQASIAGHIKGNVKVTETLELAPTAIIYGDIICDTLVVAAGALIQGKITMKGAKVEDGKSERKKITRQKTVKTEES